MKVLRHLVMLSLLVSSLVIVSCESEESVANQRGLLIVFEGIDGSGKTTLVQTVVKNLQEQNYKVIATREPGATEIGKTLRSLLMNKSVPTCTLAEFLLFAADRAQHFHELVLPALARKDIVISDRMADSSRVYQGCVKGLDQGMIQQVNSYAMQSQEPDIVFYLKIDTALAMQRIAARNEGFVAFEAEILQKKQQLVDGFETVLAGRSNVITLDATQSIEDLTTQVVAIIVERQK